MSRTVWITGAGTGIGRALALRYAAQGETVVISGRRPEALKAVADEAEGLEGVIRVLPGDVSDPGSVAAMVAALKASDLVPDLAILNAGNHLPTWGQDFSVDPYRRLMEVNYFGVVHCLAELLPHLRAHGGGQIAVVASLAGYRGLPGAAAYGASKAALINMAEALRPELASEHIDLRLINPGFVRTPLTDKNSFEMPFLIGADEAAAAIDRGLRGNAFEICTPRRFAILMKFLRLLPDRALFHLTRRMLR